MSRRPNRSSPTPTVRARRPAAPCTRALRCGDDPHKVAALIVKIGRARSPRYRYGAGRDGRWVPRLKVLMPQRLLDRLLRRSFGLGTRHTAHHGPRPES